MLTDKSTTPERERERALKKPGGLAAMGDDTFPSERTQVLPLVQGEFSWGTKKKVLGGERERIRGVLFSLERERERERERKGSHGGDVSYGRGWWMENGEWTRDGR
jgi:hypothetical protein